MEVRGTSLDGAEFLLGGLSQPPATITSFAAAFVPAMKQPHQFRYIAGGVFDDYHSKLDDLSFGFSLVRKAEVSGGTGRRLGFAEMNVETALGHHDTVVGVACELEGGVLEAVFYTTPTDQAVEAFLSVEFEDRGVGCRLLTGVDRTVVPPHAACFVEDLGFLEVAPAEDGAPAIGSGAQAAHGDIFRTSESESHLLLRTPSALLNIDLLPGVAHRPETLPRLLALNAQWQ